MHRSQPCVAAGGTPRSVPDDPDMRFVNGSSDWLWCSLGGRGKFSQGCRQGDRSVRSRWVLSGLEAIRNGRRQPGNESWLSLPCSIFSSAAPPTARIVMQATHALGSQVGFAPRYPDDRCRAPSFMVAFLGPVLRRGRPGTKLSKATELVLNAGATAGNEGFALKFGFGNAPRGWPTRMNLRTLRNGRPSAHIAQAARPGRASNRIRLGRGLFEHQREFGGLNQRCIYCLTKSSQEEISKNWPSRSVTTDWPFTMLLSTMSASDPEEDFHA